PRSPAWSSSRTAASTAVSCRSTPRKSPPSGHNGSPDERISAFIRPTSLHEAWVLFLFRRRRSSRSRRQTRAAPSATFAPCRYNAVIQSNLDFSASINPQFAAECDRHLLHDPVWRSQRIAQLFRRLPLPVHPVEDSGNNRVVLILRPKPSCTSRLDLHVRKHDAGRSRQQPDHKHSWHRAVNDALRRQQDHPEHDCKAYQRKIASALVLCHVRSSCALCREFYNREPWLYLKIFVSQPTERLICGIANKWRIQLLWSFTLAENPQSDRFAFLHIDLNSFFASVEQQLHPEYRNRPLAVVPTKA